LKGQFGKFVVIIDCVVVGVDVVLVVVFVVVAVVVDVVVVVVGVFVVVSAVVVTVVVVVVVVIVVVAVVVVVLVVVVAVVVVFAVVGGGVVLVVVLVVVEWDVGGSVGVVDDVPDVVSGLGVVVPPAHLLSLGSTSQCPWLSHTTVSIRTPSQKKSHDVPVTIEAPGGWEGLQLQNPPVSCGSAGHVTKIGGMKS